MAAQPAALKAGAALFALWSVLHLWVPFEGYRMHLESGVAGDWHMVTGGSAVPHGAYKLPTDAPTALAQSRLFLNFVTDVGGYGVLGLFVARGLWAGGRDSRIWYTLGTAVIGIADMAFLCFLVLSGVIEPGLGAVAGPIIWFLAVLITPFGLPPRGAVASKRE